MVSKEIFRVLTVGGYLYLGLSNTLALHNRLLGLLGIYPTTLKLISAHVRGFSKRDTFLFCREIAPKVCKIDTFYDAQFCPFH